MSGRSDFPPSLAAAGQALGCFALEVQIAAYNIANVSTASFKPARMELETGFQGKGVRTSSVVREGNSASSAQAGVSGTDLAREFVKLAEFQNAHAANAKVTGVAEELSETLLNLKA